MNASFGVIFDMDGVLVDSFLAHRTSWRQAAARNIAMTDEAFARTFGRTSREIIHHLWPGLFDDAAVAAFDRDKEAAYRDILRADFPEMPGASDLIASLHAADFRMAIGSSAPRENVQVILDVLPAARHFTASVNGMEVKRGKPDPEVFLTAASKLNLPPSRCAVIEDALVGVEAARRAGMTAIALTGTAPRPALEASAHYVVDRLADLSPRLISSLIASHSAIQPH